VPDKASIPVLCDLMVRAVRGPEAGSALGRPYLSHTPLVNCGGWKESVETGLTDVQPSVVLDDCESSAQLGTVARLTLMEEVPRDAKTLGKSLREWPVFRNYTPCCAEKMSKICNRGSDMLRSKRLKVSTSVGMATEAQPAVDGQTPAAQEQYGGHCFNIGRVFLPNGNVRCFLLEGTAPTDEIHIESAATAAKIQIKVLNGKEYIPKTMLLHEYLSLLGRTVSRLTQVINAPNGGRTGGGIPRPHAPEMHGWLASTLFSPSLRSDRAVPMGFYHRVIYTGMGKDTDVLGCLPVEPDANGEHGSKAFVAGCHPYSLSDMDLMGLDVPMARDKFKLMSSIMNEAHPPMVDHTVLQRVSDLWAECSPLSTLNTHQPLRRLQGCNYVRVACMETPSIPEFGDFICRIKGQVCDLANEINLNRPDSDHAYFLCPKTHDEGVLKREGTGCHIFIDVPAKTATSTIVHSLRSALKRLEYPGYEPVGDEI